MISVGTWDFSEPLAGQLFVDFLNYSKAISPSLCLMVQDGFPLCPEGQDTLRTLEPWRKSKTFVRTWPGSEIADFADYGEWRYEMALTTEVVKIVTDRSSNVYGWSHPQLPEDPHLLRPDGSVWFAATTSEKWSWLETRSGEMEGLHKSLPAVAALLQPRSEDNGKIVEL